MSQPIRPVESIRPAPGVIQVRFSDDSTVELSAPQS